MDNSQGDRDDAGLDLETGLDSTGVAAQRQRQIVFDEDVDRSRGRSNAFRPDTRRSSVSRDSIRSARSRALSTSAAIPGEFRRMSMQVSASQGFDGVDEKHGATKAGQTEKAEVDFSKVDEHLVDVATLFQRLQTSLERGMSQDSVAKRLRDDGHNVLPQRKENYLKKLAGYVFGGFCSILWIGVIIFFICWRPLGNPDPQPYNLGLAVLVIIVIFLQACFSAFQDWSTAKTMNSILDMLPSDAMVLRDGNWTKNRTSDIVVGDIVRINIGDKVPADIRLIASSGDVRFDRSAMTGEAEEIDGAIEATDDNFLETKNVGLMGTVVTNGNATGVVIFVGSKSVMGGIALATTSVKDAPTAIQREISRFVKIICGLTVILATVILCSWAGWLRVEHPRYMSVVQMLNNVMGCVVAFIPEGMPVGVALTLMMIARRMKKADVLPKSLATVEMLGCVQVICSDKTGTLTKNEMTVTSVGFIDKLLSAKDASQGISGTPDHIGLSGMHRAAQLCNEASFDPLTADKPIEERLTQGNATDGAVLKFAERALPSADAPASGRLIAQIPFNSKNKFMIRLYNGAGGADETQPSLAIVKGAPDVLLPKCTSYVSYEQNKILPLEYRANQMLSAVQMNLAKKAERVIMLCQRSYTLKAVPGSNDVEQELMEECLSELTIIGVLGIIDPPRPETAGTVAACRKAGIRFFMMTGDFGLTGAAIARQVGIFTSERDPDTFNDIRNKEYSKEVLDSRSSDNGSIPQGSLLLEGAQIGMLEDQEWDVVCGYEEIVFGRCSPEHKLTIINELKKRNISNAVTGDGVNDAPALKAADVGVAMVDGSDVALEAADLVLLGGFDSIVDGIRLGRLVFQNLQKVIAYLLPAGSWSEIWPVLLNVFFGVPAPLSSFLMIIICVFTDLFLSLSLIMEKEEFDLLSLPPRNPKKDHLINLKIYGQAYLFIGVMETIIAHSMFFLYMWKYAHIPMSSLWFAFYDYSDGFYGYTQAELTHFNTVGQSVYFVTLVILQLGNILSVRNKRLSILQADPIRKQRRNPWLILSTIISISIAIFVTEVPGIQNLFGTASIPIEFWFIPLPLALGILVMDEIRKLCVRTWPRGLIARVAW